MSGTRDRRILRRYRWGRTFCTCPRTWPVSNGRSDSLAEMRGKKMININISTPNIDNYYAFNNIIEYDGVTTDSVRRETLRAHIIYINRFDTFTRVNS